MGTSNDNSSTKYNYEQSTPFEPSKQDDEQDPLRLHGGPPRERCCCRDLRDQRRVRLCFLLLRCRAWLRLHRDRDQHLRLRRRCPCSADAGSLSESVTLIEDGGI